MMRKEVKELLEKDEKALRSLLVDLGKRLMVLSFQKSEGVKDTSVFKKLRRERARACFCLAQVRKGQK